jgi:DNA-binding NtrC family response regulator
MIKRLVILQDEQLVFAEIQSGARRTLHAVAAGAQVAALAAASPAAAYAVPVIPAAAVPPLAPAAEPEAAAEEVEAPADETSGSLASVAKAAALKAERAILEKTLTQVHWNRRKAAQILGVSYKTLLNKIKECNITRD